MCRVFRGIVCQTYGRNRKKVNAQHEAESFDWDDLESIGLGEMGLTIGELYDMTPRQFQNKRKGFQRIIEHEMQTKWETTRWLAAITIAPHTKKKLKPRDLIAFPWETKKRVHRAATFEEVQQAIKQVFGDGETTN